MKISMVAGIFGLAGLVGCAGVTAEAEDDPSTGEVAQRIADAADIAHACGHAQSPPGGAYTALSPTATASASAPVATEHSAYDLTLPGGQGWVKFTPDETAEHGIFTDPSLTPETASRGVCVKQANAAGTGTVGNCLAPAFVLAISAATCPATATLPTFGTPNNALSYVRTYNLTAGQLYFVQFRRSDSTHLYANFENLNEQ